MSFKILRSFSSILLCFGSFLWGFCRFFLSFILDFSFLRRIGGKKSLLWNGFTSILDNLWIWVGLWWSYWVLWHSWWDRDWVKLLLLPLWNGSYTLVFLKRWGWWDWLLCLGCVWSVTLITSVHLDQSHICSVSLLDHWEFLNLHLSLENFSFCHVGEIKDFALKLSNVFVDDNFVETNAGLGVRDVGNIILKLFLVNKLLNLSRFFLIKLWFNLTLLSVFFCLLLKLDGICFFFLDFLLCILGSLGGGLLRCGFLGDFGLFCFGFLGGLGGRLFRFDFGLSVLLLLLSNLLLQLLLLEPVLLLLGSLLAVSFQLCETLRLLLKELFMLVFERSLLVFDVLLDARLFLLSGLGCGFRRSCLCEG